MNPRRTSDDRGEVLRITSGADGLQIFDAVERRQCSIRAAGDVEPAPASTDAFTFPVDRAVSLTTTRLTYDHPSGTYVHDEDGRLVGETVEGERLELGAGRHVVGWGPHVKVYVEFDGSARVEHGEDPPSIAFDGETRVRVGARSMHEHPAATITTTDDPRDVMTAVSHLGSSLKDYSPERSFPTLRGHPPLVERGDELHVPEGVDPPDTGVTVEVPADYRSVFVVAPLAFYLGATVEPGTAPRLVAGDFEHQLDTHRGFEAEVERVLKQVFVLDCATRTEGLFRLPMRERDALDEATDLDFGALYDASLAERTRRYLTVPYDVVEPLVPEWKQTTHVAPTPASVELLPFLVDDLAVIRSPKTRRVGEGGLEAAAVEEFMRNEPTRSASVSEDTGLPETVRPAEADSVEQSWVGDGAPLGASKPTVQAFRNRLGRAPVAGDISVTVVCNEDQMDAEGDVVDDVYGSTEDLPFDVTVHRNLTTGALRDVLQTTTDFFHFVGHVDGVGFKCPDGLLDAATLDDVGVDAFFLNACQSYDQGMALIEGGAIAGVATVRDVVNRAAEDMGVAIARLLDGGFSMNAALNVAGTESVMSSRYVVLGDGGFALSQTNLETPIVASVEPAAEGFEVTIRAYSLPEAGMGSVVRPILADNEQYYLGSGEVGTFEVSAAELSAYLSEASFPVRVDGELCWSDELAVGELVDD